MSTLLLLFPQVLEARRSLHREIKEEAPEEEEGEEERVERKTEDFGDSRQQQPGRPTSPLGPS